MSDSAKEGCHMIVQEVFAIPIVEALWSSSGRGDLAIMKKLGANAVRSQHSAVTTANRNFNRFPGTTLRQ